jgi:hypothetical protein
MLNNDHSDALIFDQALLMQLAARCTIVGASKQQYTNMLKRKWGSKLLYSNASHMTCDVGTWALACMGTSCVPVQLLHCHCKRADNVGHLLTSSRCFVSAAIHAG